MNYKPAILLLALAACFGLLLVAVGSAAPLPSKEPVPITPDGPFTSAGGEGLFEEVMAVEATKIDPTEPWIQRQRPATIRFAEFLRPQPLAAGSTSAPPVASQLTLNLFADTILQAQLIRTEAEGESGFSWIGQVEGSEFSLVILTVREGLLIGDIFTTDALYRVRYLAADLHIIQEIDEAALPPEAPPIPVPSLEWGNTPSGPEIVDDDGTVIDVMVVYTDEVRVDAGGTAAAEALVNNFVAYTNQTYLNSGINQQLNLVRALEIDYDQGEDLGVDLDRLKGDTDGYLDEVHEFRDKTSADLVLLLVSRAKKYCGFAYVMRTVDGYFARSAFSVMADNCGARTFAHELGHNMGAAHDRFVGGSGAYLYSHGYVHAVPEGWMTIMAYSDECVSLNYRCPGIPYWSNPDISYGGLPMGIPEGDPLAADNRLTLNNTAATVANFRDTTMNGHVAGRVTSAADGSPLAGIQVEVYPSDFQTPLRTAVTGTDGRYDVDSLDTGDYKIFFRDWTANPFLSGGAYLSEWYDNKPDFESANKVPVNTGSTTTIDAALAESGRLAGLVTAKTDGAPLEGIGVAVYRENGGGTIFTYTAVDGHYYIQGLETDTYHLLFLDPEGTYVDEYYDNAWDRESATAVQVTAGSMTTVDSQLSLGGYITGQVTDKTGNGLGLISIDALYEDNGTWKVFKSTDTGHEYYTEGIYELRGLRAGLYRIRFSDLSGEDYWATEYYDNVADINSARDIRVRVLQVNAGINAVMGVTPPPMKTSTATPKPELPTSTSTPEAPRQTPTPTLSPTFTPTPSPMPSLTPTAETPATATPKLAASPTATATLGRPTYVLWLPVVGR